MFFYKFDNNNKIFSNRNIYIYKINKNILYRIFNNIKKYNNKYIYTKNIKILIISNLVFYYIILNIENIDKSWCVYCLLKIWIETKKFTRIQKRIIKKYKILLLIWIIKK